MIYHFSRSLCKVNKRFLKSYTKSDQILQIAPFFHFAPSLPHPHAADSCNICIAIIEYSSFFSNFVRVKTMNV